jgi:hypothetical protein
MHSVEESLLRSRHSVGSETDTASGRERTSTRKRESQSEQCMKPNAFSERECFEAVIQSEAKTKTKRRGSSDVCCAVICLAKPQSTIRCSMPVDIASDYPINRYYLQPTICSALLCLVSLHPTVRSALPVYITSDYPLYRLSALHCQVIYYNRGSHVLYSVC